jgi:hypothetical protein
LKRKHVCSFQFNAWIASEDEAKGAAARKKKSPAAVLTSCGALYATNGRCLGGTGSDPSTYNGIDRALLRMVVDR